MTGKLSLTSFNICIRKDGILRRFVCVVWYLLFPLSKKPAAPGVSEDRISSDFLSYATSVIIKIYYF